jgi:hypothetical protein
MLGLYIQASTAAHKRNSAKSSRHLPPWHALCNIQTRNEMRSLGDDHMT